MKIHLIVLRALAAVGAFGSFTWCLGLVGTQLYRWARDGAWPRISANDGLISLVTSCCARTDGAGRMADITRWLESPESWIGLHRVIELLPASIGLFLLSVFANFIYIYCSDRLEAQRPPAGK